MIGFQVVDLLVSGLALLTIATTAAMFRWPVD